ncbi:hypothetical protein WDZ92_46180 [Nostoc sp. NIES-2111]
MDERPAPLSRRRAGLALAAALVLGALSLAPSWAHILEAPPRLAWPLELWRETTVFNAQFAWFALAGGPIDLAAIVAMAAAAWVLRGGRGVGLAVVAAILYALALLAWFVIVSRANAQLATWVPGPMPEDAGAMRRQWEAGHITVGLLKLAGFGFLASAAGRLTYSLN